MGRERETGREWQQRNTKRDRDQVGRKSEGKVKDGCPWKQCDAETLTGRERERVEGSGKVRSPEIWEVGVKIEKDSKTEVGNDEKYTRRNREGLESRDYYKETEV